MHTYGTKAKYLESYFKTSFGAPVDLALLWGILVLAGLDNPVMSLLNTFGALWRGESRGRVPRNLARYQTTGCAFLCTRMFTPRRYKVMEGLASSHGGSHLRFRGKFLCSLGFNPGLTFLLTSPRQGVIHLELESPAQVLPSQEPQNPGM